MHTDIDYSGISDQTEKDAKAIEDIKNWLGKKKFDEFELLIHRTKQARKVPFSELQLACGIGGVQGFPVYAWARRLGVDIPEDTPE